jgi:hypothetical protein
MRHSPSARWIAADHVSRFPPRYRDGAFMTGLECLTDLTSRSLRCFTLSPGLSFDFYAEAAFRRGSATISTPA